MTNREWLDLWFEEIWNKRNEAKIHEWVADECIIHGLPNNGPHGAGGFLPVFQLFCGAFPSIEIKVDDSVENGDKIGFRCSGKFTKVDGETLNMSGGGMLSIKDGKVTEAWNLWEMLSLLEQLQGQGNKDLVAVLTDMKTANESIATA